MINEFKLIAITPLTGCDIKFHKKLKVACPYQFYKQYEISLDKGQSNVLCVKVKEEEINVNRLYKLKNEILVNISAVVGKNGSGKSTLFELLYQAIYLLGIQTDYNQKPILNSCLSDLRERKDKLQLDLGKFAKVAGLPLNKYQLDASKSYGDPELTDPKLLMWTLNERYELKMQPKAGMPDKEIYLKFAARLFSLVADYKREIDDEEAKESLLLKNFNVSIIYQYEDQIRELHCHKGKVNHYLLFGELDKSKSDISFSLEQFFYTISLNYSHHGLNAVTLGKWINKLFHKNDAYQTPLVINPMRDAGNFDINRELRLSNERLMSTLVYDLVHKVSKPLLDKYEVSYFKFIPKYRYLSGISIPYAAQELTYFEFIRTELKIDFNRDDIHYFELALNYLDQKIAKIARKYHFLFGSGQGKSDLHTFIKEDTSHITKKVRQVINYIKAFDQGISKGIWGKAGGIGELMLKPEELRDYLNTFSDLLNFSPATLVEYALPGFFNIDFEFKDEADKTVHLPKMSSGEQQMIFNLNAVLYHMYNLQSVHNNVGNYSNNSKTLEPIRPAYQNINIVLDEMELYYHPEMQRTLVKTMLDSFEHLTKEGGIKHINVCILTHSPFILSDIPSQNILHMGDHPSGSYLDQPTFAANIHDLLRNEFSMESGFMGEFAREKLNKVVDSLAVHRVIQEKSKVKKRNKSQIAALSADYRKEYSEEILTKEECEDCIQITAEPVLYQSLVSLLLQAFPQQEENIIDGQMKYLNNLKNKTAKK